MVDDCWGRLIGEHVSVDERVGLVNMCRLMNGVGLVNMCRLMNGVGLVNMCRLMNGEGRAPEGAIFSTGQPIGKCRGVFAKHGEWIGDVDVERAGCGWYVFFCVGSCRWLENSFSFPSWLIGAIG